MSNDKTLVKRIRLYFFSHLVTTAVLLCLYYGTETSSYSKIFNIIICCSYILGLNICIGVLEDGKSIQDMAQQSYVFMFLMFCSFVLGSVECLWNTYNFTPLHINTIIIIVPMYVVLVKDTVDVWGCGDRNLIISGFPEVIIMTYHTFNLIYGFAYACLFSVYWESMDNHIAQLVKKHFIISETCIMISFIATRHTLLYSSRKACIIMICFAAVQLVLIPAYSAYIDVLCRLYDYCIGNESPLLGTVLLNAVFLYGFVIPAILACFFFIKN